MPVSYRLQLFLLCLGNVVAIVLVEYLFIAGPVRNWLAKKFPKKNRADLIL